MSMVKMIGIKREMTMKRNVIIMAAISASLMMVSCAKNLTSDMEPESREDGKICYIDATIDNEITKTSLDGNDSRGYDIVWKEGDVINVGGVKYTLASGAGSTSGKFSGPTISRDGTYIAYYPFDYRKEKWGMPQKYVEGNIDCFPMKATFRVAGGKPEIINFSNEGGIFRMTIKSQETVSVTRIAVSADELSSPVILDCGQGVSLSSEGTVFHIAMPVGEYSNVKVTITRGNDLAICTRKLTSKNLVIENSAISPAIFTVRDFALPEGALPGVFSVSETKKVLFSKGNLWCDTDTNPTAANFHFEDSQYVGSNLRNETSNSHISHFMWTETAAEAVALQYNGTVATKFFAASNFKVGDVDGWMTLTDKEWLYLLGNYSTAPNFRYSKMKKNVEIDGMNYCIVIVPDNWDTDVTPISESYDAAAWAEAEAQGAVCIFPAGCRNHSGNENVVYYGSNGFYWSSNAKDNTSAYTVTISKNNMTKNDYNSRSMALSVRLVI